MKVGFVGTGPWAQTLRNAFVRAGAEVVAYDRSRPEPRPDFGQRRHWPDMMDDPEIDAIVAATPPEVTLAVAKLATNARKPVFLSKPFMIEEPLTIRAPLFVDYVRLHSSAYQDVKERCRCLGIREVRVRLYGEGPDRTFPGLFDYGPHAVAFLCDLLGVHAPFTLSNHPLAFDTFRRDLPTRELHLATGYWDGIPFDFIVGNGARSVQRELIVMHDNGSRSGYVEEGASVFSLHEDRTIMMLNANDALDRQVDAFLDAVRRQILDPIWVNISAVATRLLSKIRADAGLDR